MKSTLTLITLIFFVSFSQAQTVKTANDSLSYALGQDLAAYLKRMDLPINISALSQAFQDVLDGKPTLFTEDQKDRVISQGMNRVTEERNAKLIQKGKDYLAANKKKAGVKETPEGLQYQIIKAGKGIQPTLSDTVVVHYKGSLSDGTVFDSSYDRNEPLDLELSNVIEAWKIGIPLMKVGSKYTFFVPYNLGYGERASGPIPAFSTLIFEVELLEVKKAAIDEKKQSL